MYDKKNSILDNFSTLVLAEPDYEYSVIIRLFLENRNLAGKIKTFRDGDDTLEFLKSLQAYNFVPKAILINLELPHVEKLLDSINKEDDLKKISPIIIFSENEKSFITEKYGINKNFYVLKPMGLLNCEEIIREILKCEEIIKSSYIPYLLKEPVLSGAKRISYT